MNQSTKYISIGALAIALVVSQEAQAQSTDTMDRMGDIVVTATRRAESVQKVPVAITAITSETLDEASIDGLQDISRIAPSLQVYPHFSPGNAVFQIRGQIQSDTAPTIDPSVGVYFDDVYVARAAGSLINLVDIERVEVLKGPQGTLFGKNTTGGAVRIISKKPTDKFEGYGKVGYESFDRLALEGVINIPLSSTLATRFSGQYINKSGGYSTNVVSGNKIDKEKTWSVRGGLQWEPTDRLSVLIQGDYTKIDAGGYPNLLRYFIPQAAPFVALEAGFALGALGAGDPDLGFARGVAALQQEVDRPKWTDVSTDSRLQGAASYTWNPVTGAFAATGGNQSVDPTSDVKTWGTMANISLDLGSVTVKSITSYRRADADYLVDIDGTRFQIVQTNNFIVNKQFSQELLLNGEAAGNRLDWTVGGIYFRETPFAQDNTLALGALTFPSKGTITIADAVNKSFGGFAQGTYRLSDQLSATAGVRYSGENRGFVATAFNRNANGTNTCLYDVASGLSTAPGFTAPCSIVQKGKWVYEWSYTGSLSYQIDPEKLVYAKTSRGFRAGGFNPRINAREVLGAFKPEIVTDYELGVKADWFDGTLRTNLALFSSKASDAQTTINGVAASNGAITTSTRNIGTRTVKGVELEMFLRPTQWLNFDAAVNYLDASLDNPLEPDVSFIENVPEWTWRLGMGVDTPISDNLAGNLRVDFSYRGKMHDGQAVRDPVSRDIIFLGYSRAADLLSARYSILHKESGASISVYGRNLLNDRWESRIFNIASLGLGLANLGEPRVFGVELKVPFGAK